MARESATRLSFLFIVTAARGVLMSEETIVLESRREEAEKRREAKR